MFLVNPSKLSCLPFVVFLQCEPKKQTVRLFVTRANVLFFFFVEKIAFHLSWDVTEQWLLLRGETLLIQVLGNHTSRRTHVNNKTCTIQ